jgi:hypothetical protein
LKKNHQTSNLVSSQATVPS